MLRKLNMLLAGFQLKTKLRSGFYLAFVASLLACGMVASQDRGLNTPLSKLRNKFADLLSQAERQIPRSQKFQILNTVRHRLQADPKSKEQPQQYFELAEQYKRYRFYEEALQLYEQVDKNPASDKELRMEVNRCLGEVKFVANSDLKAAINHFNKAIALSPEKSLVRGELLNRQASYYLGTEQIDQMLENFAKINQLPDHVKKALPTAHLRANLYSARYTKDPEEAAKLFERAREIAVANPQEFPADLVLGILSELGDGQPWNSPDRIKRLAKLVKDKTYAKDPKIRNCAMDVFLAYFLERDKEWKRFEEFAETALKLYETFDTDKAVERRSSAFGCQCIGIWVGAAEQAKKKWDKTKSQKNFGEWKGKLKTTGLYFPQNIKRKELDEIVKAYRLGEKLLKSKPKKKSKRQ